jgi:hypothetical protein
MINNTFQALYLDYIRTGLNETEGKTKKEAGDGQKEE